MRVNDLVNDALLRWAGLHAGEKNSWEFNEQRRDLNASRDLDPTGLTAFMMVRGLLEEWLKDRTFTGLDIVTDFADVSEKLAPARALRELLEDPQIAAISDAFVDKLRDAAKHYALSEGRALAFEDLLADKYDLAYVRRDALRSMERLAAHQFVQGEPDAAPLKFNPEIFEFWNVNSLLRAMIGQKESGITLCLIRDPELELASYFVFAVRNGETLTILTDREEGPHPAFNRMSRRPDRNFERRAAKHWFPYHLLDLERTPDDEYLKVKARSALVPIDAKAVVLACVGDLYPEEFVWLTLVFELILDRYGRQNALLPEVSYTGEMVVAPNALIGEHGALAVAGRYTPLAMASLTRKDVTAKTTRKQWAREPVLWNRWMIERYGDQVPDEVLNPVGEGARLIVEAAVDALALDPADRRLALFEKKSRRVETLSPVTFGTRDKLEKDRLWVARVNQMRTIDRLARDEYERENKAIRAWCKERLSANREALLDAAACGELLGPRQSFWEKGTIGFLHGYAKEERTNLLSQRVDRPNGGGYADFGVDEGETPALYSHVAPTCPGALAILYGVAEEDLPWPLRHWYPDEPYRGNSILERLDPEDWILKNPWRGIGLSLRIAQSRSAYNARRKALGLPLKRLPEPPPKDDERWR